MTHAIILPPEITEPPQPKPLLTLGKNHALTCNASGEPLPNITWAKDGIPVDKFNVIGYHFHLMNVKREDVGSYRCTASNGYGDDATSVSIVGIRCNDCKIRIVKLTLQSETWKSALNNKESVEFKILQAKLSSNISSVYAQNPGKQLYIVSLVEFRAGSVVAIVELKFGKSVNDPLKPLKDKIKDGKLGSFIVGPEIELPSTT
ncbi:brother of CDO-like, partial [Pocillopora damicornis]|uniref:brother of CDO-like n=1 Tax=Pocillopora damicornis TaxID=46731 RepID=UPI000F54E3A4